MHITFQYHNIERNEEEERIARKHIAAIEHRGHNIISAAFHFDRAHEHAVKLRLKVQVGQHRTFNSSFIIEHKETRLVGMLRMLEQLDHWLDHKKSKQVDRSYPAGHTVNHEQEEE